MIEYLFFLNMLFDIIYLLILYIFVILIFGFTINKSKYIIKLF